VCVLAHNCETCRVTASCPETCLILSVWRLKGFLDIYWVYWVTSAVELALLLPALGRMCLLHSYTGLEAVGVGLGGGAIFPGEEAVHYNLAPFSDFSWVSGGLNSNSCVGRGLKGV